MQLTIEEELWFHFVHLKLAEEANLYTLQNS